MTAAMKGCSVHCTAPQQVHAAAAELACAGPGQHEAGRRRLLQQGMDHREQLRRTLYLVDDHRGLVERTRKPFPKALGTGVHAAMRLRVQQIDVQGVGKPVTQPRGLAGPAGAEQKATPVRYLKESTYQFHFVSKSGITDSIIGLFRTWARQPRGRHPALPQAFGRDGSRWKGSGQTGPGTPLLLTAKRRLPAHGRPRHRPGSSGRR